MFLLPKDTRDDWVLLSKQWLELVGVVGDNCQRVLHCCTYFTGVSFNFTFKAATKSMFYWQSMQAMTLVDCSCRSSDDEDEELLEMLATMKTVLEDSCKASCIST